VANEGAAQPIHTIGRELEARGGAVAPEAR
jgi:hypothetical protein